MIENLYDNRIGAMLERVLEAVRLVRNQELTVEEAASKCSVSALDVNCMLMEQREWERYVAGGRTL